MGELILKRSIKYIGIAAALFLTSAPIVTPIISMNSEMVVKADDTQDYGDYNFDVASHGPANLGMTVDVDGQSQHVWTSMVYASKVGDVATVQAPLVDGHVPNSQTVSFLRTSSGYRLMTDLHYTKSDPKTIASLSTTEENKEVVKVGNSDGSYSPLFAFSNDGKKSKISDRALSNESYWYSDKIKTYDGARYYRVATNEWVKDTNVLITKSASIYF